MTGTLGAMCCLTGFFLWVVSIHPNLWRGLAIESCRKLQAWGFIMLGMRLLHLDFFDLPVAKPGDLPLWTTVALSCITLGTLGMVVDRMMIGTPHVPSWIRRSMTRHQE